MDMDEIKKFLKELISKKYVANIMVVLAVAVIALIFSSEFLAKDSSYKNNIKETLGDTLVQEDTFLKTEEEIIEARLKEILEKIKGSGKVEVMVTFELGAEIVPALNTVESKDTTEEKDANGGVRTVTSQNITENIVTVGGTSGNNPMVLKEIKPQVRGVIVVAEGAEDPEVKMRLYDAVKTVLQVSANKVQVYSRD
ncbi:stage III sporulation protein AG [Alkaliphilus oremlandii]|uniref:Sporulation stage III protein AG n=1 Tax=Alkaliphilus oremlandii (strain OhILAs) TaxID=350688 RepID=A8MFJ6_ALKOO|nr:stage III sporulation protein AG [Alkaliphilus oremlandii]ABW19159.1 Sporulation stage III protein AG [Alkaliphilus oremlandii OhILAs]